MTIIFLDECGYTGQDLLNTDQPFFALASLLLDEQSCIDIKKQFFSVVKARELKHSALSKSRAQQKMVLDFLSYLKSNPDIVKISLANKRYALTCKVVDLIVEPFLYEEGIDLYDKGGNLAMANIIFHGMPVLAGEEFFADFLSIFQNMIRHKTTDSYERFFDFVFDTQESNTLDEMLELLRTPLFTMGYQLINTLPENSLDIAVSLAFGLMAAWRQVCSDPINLIHDASSNMSRQKFIWDAIVSPDVPPTTVGYDRRKMTFPIAVHTTALESSERWVGLQLADVIAGAFVRSATWVNGGQDPSDTYASNLTSIIGDMKILPLLPESGLTPSELRTTGDNAQDPNDFLVRVLYEAERDKEENSI